MKEINLALEQKTAKDLFRFLDHYLRDFDLDRREYRFWKYALNLESLTEAREKLRDSIKDA